MFYRSRNFFFQNKRRRKMRTIYVSHREKASNFAGRLEFCHRLGKCETTAPYKTITNKNKLGWRLNFRTTVSVPKTRRKTPSVGFRKRRSERSLNRKLYVPMFAQWIRRVHDAIYTSHEFIQCKYLRL